MRRQQAFIPIDAQFAQLHMQRHSDFFFFNPKFGRKVLAVFVCFTSSNLINSYRLSFVEAKNGAPMLLPVLLFSLLTLIL